MTCRYWDVTAGIFAALVMGLEVASAQVNQVPVSRDDSINAPFNTAVTLLTPGVMANDTAPAATVAIVTPPTSGTVNVAPTGGVTFTPSPGFIGTTLFTYRATNQAGTGNVATMRITVLPPDVPQGVTDVYATDQGVPLTVPAPGVLLNDVSPNGSPLSAALLFGSTAGGTVALQADGAFVYTPRPDYAGRDSFFYHATNSAGTSNLVRAEVNVAPAPSAIQAPTGLFARSLNGNTLSLQWNPPVGGVTPTAFRIEGGVAPGQVLAFFDTFAALPSFTFDVPNGAFYVRVRALANGQAGPASNEIRAFVNQPIAASASTRLLGLANGSSLTLSWRNAVAAGDLSNAILDVAGPVSLSIPLGATDRFRFDGVPPGTYSFAIRASNARNIGFTPSNHVLLTFPATCSGPPAVPTAFAAYQEAGVVSVLWDTPTTGTAVDGYLLNVSGAYAGTLPVAGRSFSAPAPAGSYTFSVSAFNACGVGPATAAQTVVVP